MTSGAHPGGAGQISNSDKAFWHRYVDFYERVFESIDRVERVFEFGVLHGNSIRWLAERFPEAQIVGADITPQQPSWPVSPRIRYEEIDQGERAQIRALFERLDTTFDLIIDDGSHRPPHQRNCLVEALPYVRAGGVYILEDLQTSHPEHEVYKSSGNRDLIGPLHLLLAIEHLKAGGRPLDDKVRTQLSSNSLFTGPDVERVWSRVRAIEIYRRATLPLRCYECQRADGFDFGSLRCACGMELYAGIDSMSAAVYV